MDGRLHTSPSATPPPPPPPPPTTTTTAATLMNLNNTSERQLWAAIPPVLCVAFLVVYPYVPWERVLPTWWKVSMRPFLPIWEAEVMDLDNEDGSGRAEEVREMEREREDAGDVSGKEAKTKRDWKVLLMSALGLVQTLWWSGLGSYALIASSSSPGSKDVVRVGISSFLMALAWLYTTLYPILKTGTKTKNEMPRTTGRTQQVVPVGLFIVYLMQLFGAVLMLGGGVYDAYVGGSLEGSGWMLAMQTVNLGIVMLLLGIAMSFPLAVPGRGVDSNAIGVTICPEDYCTLWEWTTFRWMYPLIHKGRHNTLNEPDVWQLSLANQSRLLFERYTNTPATSLLNKLWKCNSYDIIRDILIAITCAASLYLNPYFLNKILTVIDNPDPTPESTASAYIYAFLMFSVSLARALVEAQHLFYTRRALVRIRAELMAAVYDKSLKRKDLSGIVHKMHGSALGKDADDETKGDEPRAGADTGKIVNLMSTDANKVAEVLLVFYYIFTAPLEVVIGTIFLYKLLGVASFIGFIIFAVFGPINSQIVKRSVNIQKGLSTARDKRMAVLTELVGAIKFIKFFAWEDLWVKRAMDARNVEMRWIIKARINSVLMMILWVIPPVLVSITSFLVYVAFGNRLTVSTAFTSLALFTMTREPMTMIPMNVMRLMESKVSLDRLAKFLEEEEVTEQVSSLKRNDTLPPSGHNDSDSGHGLGLEDATCRWNVVTDQPSEGLGGAGDSSASSSPATSTASGSTHDNENYDSVRFGLKDISVLFPEGQMTVVTGPTASGKTALLMAVLGELTLIRGRIIMSKEPTQVLPGGLTQSISYAAQTPWLRHQSIRDNIIFDSEWDEKRYVEVVECCALEPDFQALEDGDLTEIGAKGVNLSGGQKARVALARAIYARTKYVLLDDPLSAVDSHTARFLFDKLFCGPLLKNRTVVLVTHHLELVLPGTHYLIQMLDGRIDTQGTVKDLLAQGSLDDIKHEATVQTRHEERAGVVLEGAVAAMTEEDLIHDKSVIAKKPRKLVQEEHRESGGVGLEVYKHYLGATSYWLWTTVLLLLIVSQFSKVGEKYWIKKWGETYSQLNTSVPTFAALPDSHHLLVMNQIHTSSAQQPLLDVQGSVSIARLPDPHDHTLYYIGIYATIGMSTAFALIIATIGRYVAAVMASRRIFKLLLTKVVCATMRWYDVTPQGRILNRFGKDIETIDSTLSDSLQNISYHAVGFIAAILTVVLFFPWFIVPAFFLLLLYRELVLGYLHTSRDLRRMESTSRSPIFSDFSEIIEGIVTVRAFSVEKRFLRNIHKKIDTMNTMFHYTWMANRWISLNLSILNYVGVLITTLFALSGYASPGTAGLCITTAMTLTTSAYWFCRYWTALELDLNSIERVSEYLDIPEEPAPTIESERPPAYWPSSSSNRPLLSVQNLTVKYAPDLPSVLRNISFSANARERIGLLGRTGSGKSTLAMSLLRFIDPASGRIVVDGVDISKIGTHDLRSRVTFIPQDATLFSGTLRDNLDPFHEHDDRECLDALHRVHMINDITPASRQLSRDASVLDAEQAVLTPESITPIASTAGDSKVVVSLYTMVSAGGSNFSQGQRQLIAMARALLRRSSIIILDEATSSIDFETDSKIQATIRKEFNDSLLLTVAHRLRTVIDYDRLLVLDNGQISEFDTPYNLIRKEGGIFRNMCLKSGTFAELEAAARQRQNPDGVFCNI